MDNEFLNGMILSYNKILKEINFFKNELNLIKSEIACLSSKMNFTGLDTIKGKAKKLLSCKTKDKLVPPTAKLLRKKRKVSLENKTNVACVDEKENNDFFINLGNS